MELVPSFLPSVYDMDPWRVSRTPNLTLGTSCASLHCFTNLAAGLLLLGREDNVGGFSIHFGFFFYLHFRHLRGAYIHHPLNGVLVGRDGIGDEYTLGEQRMLPRKKRT